MKTFYYYKAGTQEGTVIGEDIAELLAVLGCKSSDIKSIQAPNMKSAILKINELSGTDIIIIRTDIETGTKEPITFKEAKRKLEGYWNVDYIEGALLKGEMLHTPYAEYQLKK